jgi:hypothetical protein
MPIPREKLAWVAAVLDMKGTIIVKSNQTRATPQIVLMVESTQVRVVEELARLTGSTVEPRESRFRPAWMRRGCITHCPEPDIEYPEQPDYLPAQTRWTVTGSAAAIVLFSVIPYMVTDRGMQTALEEILGNVNLSGRSGNSARQAVTRLARLGWVLPPVIARQAETLGLLEKTPHPASL